MSRGSETPSTAPPGWLGAVSDRLSPMVVKEVRQFVRGRDFLAAFSASLLIALAIAAYGSADAIGGNRTAGGWTFTTLTGCLALLGLAVVPIGAFSTLRTERVEQTLELISLTTLSSRQIVVGKLLAQGVKLVTFFAVMGPFIATSFLLGGVDFVTILLALVTVFLWSMWVAAGALFLSTLIASRVMSGLALGVLGIVLFIGFSVGRALLNSWAYTGGFTGAPASPPFSLWAILGPMAVGCVMTMVNLVLLAEHRLALPVSNHVAALRAGFFVQFLLLVAWAFAPPFRSAPAGVQMEWLTVTGGLHLALVALFAVTEPLTPEWQRPPRRGRARILDAILGPGGSRGAVYVLVQMSVFLAAGWALGGVRLELNRLLAVCGCICLFTGVPALLVYRFRRFGLGPLHARGVALVMVFLSLVLPDVLYYTLTQPEVFSMSFSARHLLSPVRTLFNWYQVEFESWHAAPLAWGVVGLASYVLLIGAGLRAAERESPLIPLALSATGDGHDSGSH